MVSVVNKLSVHSWTSSGLTLYYLAGEREFGKVYYRDGERQLVMGSPSYWLTRKQAEKRLKQLQEGAR
jgi:hypothetical protein